MLINQEVVCEIVVKIERANVPIDNIVPIAYLLLMCIKGHLPIAHKVLCLLHMEVKSAYYM
jgi:hypothetical protein